MAEGVQELCVPSDLSHLREVAQFVEACCIYWQIDEVTAHRIQLAVDEATTNVIEHAYTNDQGEVVLQCWTHNNNFCVEIHDQGRPFDPGDVPQPAVDASLEEREVGGLGLYLIRKVMDEVEFSFGEEGNVLRLVKYDAVP